MDGLRRPLQGVSNILRFNWHFYVLALGGAAAIAGASAWLEGIPRLAGISAVGVLGSTILVSLLVSWCVYDLSSLYRLEWLEAVAIGPGGKMANIHAGFDETSPLLRARYPEAEWTVMDFYDPAKHTEISIKRAREAYPPSPDDVSINTSELPISSASMDTVFVVLAAHEIRDKEERHAFFRELHRVLKPEGQAVLVEHLRDLPNFFAYTLGAFHFISRKAWLAAFARAQLHIAKTITPNPFMTCFVLEKDGATP